METLILALLGTLCIALSPNNSDTKDENKYNTTNNKISEINNKIKVDRTNKNKTLYNKLNNMTEFEIDKWLKNRDLFNTYGSYGRQTKINKISKKYKYIN